MPKPRADTEVLARYMESSAPRFLDQQALPIAAVSLGISYDKALSLVRSGWLEVVQKRDGFLYVSNTSIAIYNKHGFSAPSSEKGRWYNKNRMVLRRREKKAKVKDVPVDPSREYLEKTLGDPREARIRNTVVLGYPAIQLVDAIRNTGILPVARWLDVTGEHLMSALKHRAGVHEADCGIVPEKPVYSKTISRFMRTKKYATLLRCKQDGLGREETAKALRVKPSHVDQCWQLMRWDLAELKD